MAGWVGGSTFIQDQVTPLQPGDPGPDPINYPQFTFSPGIYCPPPPPPAPTTVVQSYNLNPINTPALNFPIRTHINYDLWEKQAACDGGHLHHSLCQVLRIIRSTGVQVLKKVKAKLKGATFGHATIFQVQNI